MSSAQQPKYFLEEYAEKVLVDLGITNLTEIERKRFLPQIITNIELRLGDALLPHVPDTSASEFRSLMEKETAPDEWMSFWKKTVPNFEALVARVLKEFAEESKKIFAS